MDGAKLSITRTSRRLPVFVDDTATCRFAPSSVPGGLRAHWHTCCKTDGIAHGEPRYMPNYKSETLVMRQSVSADSSAPPSSPPVAVPLSQAIWAASIGTAFEWYDFALYGSLAAVLAGKFFSGVDSKTAFLFALLTFGVGFTIRPLGALIFGRIGDRIGRKRTFVVTICMMGGATIGVGLLPTYESVGLWAPFTLIALRMLQGLAAGGEYTGALTYVAEHSPNRRRGFNVSWTTAAATVGLLLSFGAILLAREISGAGFDTWGWRMPFVGSIVMLAISLLLRLRMEESPVFKALLANKRISRAPLKETFLDPVNVGRLLIAFLLCAGETGMYYVAALYPTFFLTQTLKVGPATVTTLVLLATIACLPVFPLAGWLCDRLGRKPVFMIGFVATAALIFPIFHGLAHFANPELSTAQAKAPITVTTDTSTCSWMFDPLGTRRFVSACDNAKRALAAAGVSYSIVGQSSASTDAATTIRVGRRSLSSIDTSRLDPAAAKQRSAQLASAVRDLLVEHGYPQQAGSARINAPMVWLLMVIFLSAAIVAVMPVGPALVEMFPTRIRYTSMSVPYNLAAGWVGGLLPTFVFAISTQTGNIFSGLWYPLGWTLIALVVLILFFRETRDVDISAAD
ncbi:MFS transporter [Burkholderia multivorans]|uniref:MFS transporter n=1 Tax=Burkholderia multivorans TaxID=87883 RepID=UPI001E35B3A7|nr:MFS transporter [Burkholderia multivorans]